MKIQYEINEASAIYDFSILLINITSHVKVDFVIAGQVFQTWSSAHTEIDPNHSSILFLINY